MKITIGVKTLNEERNIARTLQSAVQALEPFGGEIILADSGSRDKTIEIARNFPVSIVQLEDSSQRGCGAGAQLAFQHVSTEYFYLLDGDMVLHQDFLREAVEFLDSNITVAGVGGRIREMNMESNEFRIRANTLAREGYEAAGFVDRLDGGGLYRVAAIKDVGYFADRNLHAFEEFELGARLQAKGWKLASIDRNAVDHFGHRIHGYGLMWRRLMSGYSGGAGEVVRAAYGAPHFWFVARNLSHIKYCIVVLIWWLSLLISAIAPVQINIKILTWVLLIVTPIAVLTWRRKSLELGLYSFINWNVGAIALIGGLFRKRVSPRKQIRSVIIASNYVEKSSGC